MSFDEYLQSISLHLIQTHAGLLDWFDVISEQKTYRPTDGGWTIGEILEHVALTSHYLMILIDKGAKKAMRKASDDQPINLLNRSDFLLDRLDKIGKLNSFPWIRPAHMEPTGIKPERTIKAELTDQLRRCLIHLHELNQGEGLLHSTTMTVNDLGRLNVYEYIYFLSKHAERHIQQMEDNSLEYNCSR